MAIHEILDVSKFVSSAINAVYTRLRKPRLIPRLYVTKRDSTELPGLAEWCLVAEVINNDDHTVIIIDVVIEVDSERISLGRWYGDPKYEVRYVLAPKEIWGPIWMPVGQAGTQLLDYGHATSPKIRLQVTDASDKSYRSKHLSLSPEVLAQYPRYEK